MHTITLINFRQKDIPPMARKKFFAPLPVITLLLILLVSCKYFQPDKPEPLSLMQLQEMADMATVEFTVSKIVKATNSPAWYKYGDRRILISCKARIIAGVDMSEMKDEDMEINGSTIRLEIPGAKLIALNMDPESISEEYVKTGFFRSPFSNEDRYDLLQQAEAQIRDSIEEMGIIQTAEANAVLFFESWLRLLGFESIQVVVKESGSFRN